MPFDVMRQSFAMKVHRDQTAWLGI
jgi:hypothetical protein